MSGKQARTWAFTLNNYTDEEVEDLNRSLSTDAIRYAIYGKEKGESGTPHLQGYLSFQRAKRLGGVKKFIGTRYHLEVARGNEEQNFIYCSKEGDYTEFGKRTVQGKRSDLQRVGDLIKEGKSFKEIAEAETSAAIRYGRGIRDVMMTLQSSYDHDTVRGVWIWGPPGSGKSHAARAFDTNAYLKSQSKWWDGYAGEETVIIDDLDSNQLGHLLKIWFDKYACTGETKGGTVRLRHKKLIITSNYTPDDLWGIGRKDNKPPDPQMVEAMKRRFIMNHKQFKETEVKFN